MAHIVDHFSIRFVDQFSIDKYICLPTDEQLRAEIEAQKTVFYAQHPELKDKI